MVIVITGPTAVGKTKLSVELAKKINGEIINADSTQVYKGMDIATAKIKKEEKENIPHHLFDIKNIDEDYTIYDYQKDCRNKIEEILSKGKTPILVGGSGLYIKSALYDYQFQNRVKDEYENIDTDSLYEKLVSLDPKTIIHKNNRKRIINALNYINNTNEKHSEKEKTDKILYDTIFIGLTTDRNNLYSKINDRVDKMLSEGLIDEAKKIYETNIRSKAVMTPIGYKELFPYFNEEDTKENCVEKIKQNSRKYAKRQYTFFNHQLPIKWFETNYLNFNKTIDEVYKYILMCYNKNGE